MPRRKKLKAEQYHSTLAQMLGVYIRESRLAQKKTQQDIIKRLGFSVQFYGRIENGTVMAPQDALSKLVKELGLDYGRVLKIFKAAAVDEVESIFRSSKKSRASK